ncbi:MAG: hypothetical protein PVJ05_01940 [Candidatus Thorarchaeota archaeon]|jgi:hypothetical protein
MSRFFRRKKKEEKKAEPKPEEASEVVEAAEEEAVPEPTEEEAAAAKIAEEVPEGRGDTIPYHDSIQDRLVYMLNDPRMADGLEGTHEFELEFMAMGERFWIRKAPLGEIETKVGKADDEDAHIRLSNDAVSELLTAATFADFSRLYLKYYKTSEAGKFIKIEARKPISDLNRRGYARVPVLKLLIGAAR